MNDKIIERVQKLLRLGESDNANESALALSRAQALMDEHAITQAMLSISGEDVEDEDAEEIREWEEALQGETGKSKIQWKRELGRLLCHANGCRTFNRGSRQIIVGRESSVSRVRYLFAYCEREVARLAKAAHVRGNGKTWSNNFKLGCVDAINAAVIKEQRELRDNMRAKAPTGSALMVLNQAIQKVDAHGSQAQGWMDSNLNLTAGRGYANVQSHWGARQMGAEAGRSIYSNAGAKRIGGPKPRQIN